MAPQSLKKSYRCSRSLKQFYSGGPFIVSSDGSFIVCACGDAINIVDASDSSVKSTIEGESDTLTALALSPDDKLLFSGGHSRQIRVWDLETLKCIRTWKGHEGPVMGMACHASGGLLATAGADRKVLVWDVDGGFCTHYFKGHKGVVSSVLFHPDANKNIFVLYQTFNILPPTEIVQVKGIGELLEGLIPYSQRHFNRMDRFVRSSFLLDYTLGEMSVIDPEAETEYPKDKKIEEEFIASVSAIEQETEADQKTPSRKRKSQKSKDRSSKKRLVAEAQGNVIAV
ncbi:hypothetical protein BRARA_B00677 [Brassica rapa]|uniref:U3 small nucleolar RNA-associated protein 13 C-terminal domain-containing protein n=1 Tax=Brassica campestris TaxID=3711 RepID=A0A398AE11_BRACM|nr:hypothetical protein BRARA_B00677 [Brassica rapa]